MNTSNLLKAIRVVKENERIAALKYQDASEGMLDNMGKSLFRQLSEFEQYHYVRLTALEKSLEEGGEFIDYEGKEFPMPPAFEIKAATDYNQKSLMQIVTEARDLEMEAAKAYAALAEQIPEAKGREMFIRLADEERVHFRILTEAYAILNDLGTWTWARSGL